MNKKQFISKIAVMAIIIIIFAALFFFSSSIISMISGKVLLKAGQPMQFGAYTVLIDRIEGNKLYGIKVSNKNRKFKAVSGNYLYLPKQNAIKFNLIDGVADDYDPQNPRQYHTLTFKQFYITLQLK
ncbi:MAG TPA: hypothetical protein PL125_06775 [Candidatus Omnitrophota bacterium]|nr:hypothetical protein [Candidatus Omnitrophota bacterium]HPT39879.1 hypothetical protein [Candidatus Omnitrophota bacterium]